VMFRVAHQPSTNQTRSPYRVIVHSPEVISNDAFNIVEIELKRPGTGKTITSNLDPVKIDPKHYKLEFENAQVRVLRVKIEAQGTAPMHEHSLNRVTVFLTDQKFRVKDSHGEIKIMKHKAGDAVWGTPTTHTEENLSNDPFEAVEPRKLIATRCARRSRHESIRLFYIVPAVALEGASC